jgi:hypothetical protein
VGLPQSSLAAPNALHRDDLPFRRLRHARQYARQSVSHRAPRTLSRPDCALAAPNNGCPGPPRRVPGPSGNICHTVCHAYRREPLSEPDQCHPHVTAFGRPRKYLTPRIGEVKCAAEPLLKPWHAYRCSARSRALDARGDPS